MTNQTNDKSKCNLYAFVGCYEFSPMAWHKTACSFALSKNCALISNVTTLKCSFQQVLAVLNCKNNTFSCLNTALNQQYEKTHLVQTGCQKNPRQESPHYYIPERNALKQEMLFATGRIHKRSLVASTERSVARADASVSVLESCVTSVCQV